MTNSNDHIIFIGQNYQSNILAYRLINQELIFPIYGSVSMPIRCLATLHALEDIECIKPPFYNLSVNVDYINVTLFLLMDGC